MPQGLAFYDVLIVMLAAVAVPLLLGLAPSLPIPSSVVEIAAGILIGPAVLNWVGDDTVIDGLDDRSHPGQRCTQVVRNPGDELPARGLQCSLAESGRIQPRLHDVELVRELSELLRCTGPWLVARRIALASHPPRDVDE